MRLLTILLAMVCLMVINIGQVQAQTKATTKSSSEAKATFTDEDLKKYAITMDSIKGMQLTLNDIITEMVQKNTVMSVQRYNELFKIANDQAKLAEKQATPEEIKFLKDVTDKRTEEMARVNATYQGLVKEYVGVKTFNAIKKSLETDQELKAKYESMSKELESKSGE
ncbi:MAG TPA: hypothetical protein VGD65_18655 [Chryseosolibacter sp.]